VAGEEWQNINNMLRIYTPTLTSRLEYIVQVLMNALGVEYKVTVDQLEFSTHNEAKINYSSDSISSSFQIVPVELLFENTIVEQSIDCTKWNELTAFYKTSSPDFPFDIFAASFYLITRYEEYLPHQLDSYGRYGHENSVAFKQNFLHQPMVNLWLQEFKKALKQKFPLLVFKPAAFSFVPTYDVDIAWSYMNKGFTRNAAGALKAMAKGEWSMVKERVSVLQGKQPDPFNIYELLDELHSRFKLNSVYFFLLAEKQKGYDKNISPQKKELQELILKQASKSEVGIHPSWQSGDDESFLKKEILQLKKITGKEVTSSRQHYIRLKLPDTYRQLISAGIERDYSMGYGSINGFRASYCLPYKWYDLQKDEVTSLTIYPFCYMEANSYYEQHFSLQQATEELEDYNKRVRQVDGMLITIMHNHLLGDKILFKGWKEMYEAFITKHFS
jgi:hypothetical protein